MSKSIALFIAAALSTACVALPVQAEPQKVSLTLRVTSEGLDLATEAGARSFLDRVSRATGKVCGGDPAPSPLMLELQRKFAACRRQALDAAIAQSGSATVRRLYVERTGGPDRLARR